MNNLHAHVSTSAADCDGPIYRSYVEVFNEDEQREHAEGEARGYNDFSDISFMNRVFANKCGPYAVHQMRITVDEAGFEWHEDTEEGYRAGEVRWCHDECDESLSSQRDVFAEQMGY